MQELNLYYKLQRHVCRKHSIPEKDNNRIRFYIGIMDEREFEHITQGVPV